VACGRGRNAHFLAELGFEVDAIDVDQAAVDELRRTGGAITAIAADVTLTRFPREPYDVIVNVNFLARSILSRLSAALAADGLLVFETFTRDHVDVLGQRMNRSYLLEPNELLRAFADLRVLHYREAVLDGERPRAVAGLVARNAAAV